MKRKRGGDSDSDPAADEDFVPDAEEEEEELEEMEDDDHAEDLDLDARTTGKGQSSSSKTFVSRLGRPLGAWAAAPAIQTLSLLQASGYLKSSNGLSYNIMKPVWEAIETTKKL